MRSYGVLFTFLLVAASPSMAQNAANQELLSSRSLRCTFDAAGSSTSWDSGVPVTTKDKMPDPIHFDSIDTAKKTARMIANAGSSDVAVLRTRAGLTFLEPTGSGNVVVTTVFASPILNKKRFIAVMSRHMDMVGPFVSQYHGTCTRW